MPTWAPSMRKRTLKLLKAPVPAVPWFFTWAVMPIVWPATTLDGVKVMSCTMRSGAAAAAAAVAVRE